MATQLQTLLQEVNDAFSRGDIDFFAAHCTDDVRWEMVGSETTEGKRALLESMQPSGDPVLPDITLESIITHGNRAAVVGTMQWTDVTGVARNYSFCNVYTMRGFKEPKIREVKSFFVAVDGQNSG